MSELPVLAVVGPTGSGKSDLAVRVAAELGGEVVNADAMQFYRGMDIGTAKMPVVERRGIAHHLLDILDVTQEASVSAYQGQARGLMDAIRSRGHYPVLTGGSGLYVRAALDVLEFPGTDPQIRRRLESELERQGLEEMRRRLERIDPRSAERIADARRLVRALEVHELTGRPFSSYLPQRVYHQDAVQIGLRGNRQDLTERLADRVAAMERAGLLEEVRRLDTAGLRKGRTASRALGYSQFLGVLDGRISVPEAVTDTVAATRKLARRQLTWFRADARIHWLDWQDPLLVERAVSIVRSHPSVRSAGPVSPSGAGVDG